jgi:hypothetical protein
MGRRLVRGAGGESGLLSFVQALWAMLTVGQK